MKTIYTDEIKDWLKENLTDEKYRHSLGTAQTAKILAQRLGYDEERAYLAGLLHDCAKNLSQLEQFKFIKEADFQLIQGEIDNEKLLHAPVGAILAKNLFNVKDEEILSAIRWHTLGKINMNLLEKIIYLSDKIEPETRGKEEFERRLKAIDLQGGLEKEIFNCYVYTINSLVKRQLKINLHTIEVYNSFLKLTYNYTN